MITLLQAVASVFEFFNKIATRLREIRLERAIRRDMTNKARESVEKSMEKVRAEMRKKYGNRVDDL